MVSQKYKEMLNQKSVIREICVKKKLCDYILMRLPSQLKKVKWHLPPIPRNWGIGRYVAMYQQITRNYRHLS